MTKIQKGRRSCNASCHKSFGDTCQCICHGENHGIDLEEYQLPRSEIVVKTRRIPKHERQQLKLFELPED